MFQLLVTYAGWARFRDSIDRARVLEYTSDELSERLAPNGKLDLKALTEIPAIFMSEVGGDGDQMARIGAITRVQQVGTNIQFEYMVDDSIPAFHNDVLEELARDLGIDRYEFSRTHWSVKDIDLYRALLTNQIAALPAPRVFALDRRGARDGDLVSIMMPFEPRFDDIYQTIVAAAGDTGMTCRRADDIWQHDQILQDVVSLIYRSRMVVCDCTGRNANVFYETGIAHTLGRDVVLIAQAEADIPFDLRHLRHIRYVNDAQGRVDLRQALSGRIRAIRNG